jgi:Holliday junction resolvasome RuvABC endonuclease subunit
MKEIIKPDDAADGLALAICHFIKSTQPAKPAKIKKEKAETVKAKKTKKA